jgi:hypothetical protein
VTRDEDEIADVIRVFFAAFASGPDLDERLDAMRALFVPTAVIARTCGLEPTIYDVDGFIAPRRELLSGGSLTEFREWALDGETRVFGDVAHHWGTYAKAGVQDGAATAGRGTKTMQLIRTSAGWRITSVAWDDERDGLSLD